jgi:hypothetical protein
VCLGPADAVLLLWFVGPKRKSDLRSMICPLLTVTTPLLVSKLLNYSLPVFTQLMAREREKDGEIGGPSGPREADLGAEEWRQQSGDKLYGDIAKRCFLRAAIYPLPCSLDLAGGAQGEQVTWHKHSPDKGIHRDHRFPRRKKRPQRRRRQSSRSAQVFFSPSTLLTQCDFLCCLVALLLFGVCVFDLLAFVLVFFRQPAFS